MADPSLFIMHIATICIFILVYVDDIMITSFSSMVVDNLITSLNQAFPIKDLGRLSYFFGLELEYLLYGIIISQQKYVFELLKKTGMSGANSIPPPMSASTNLSKFNSPSFDNITLLQSLVDNLQYLSLTRPLIAFSIDKIC